MLDDDPSFQYDKVFGQDCNQTDVFEAVLNNSVSSVLDGRFTKAYAINPNLCVKYPHTSCST